MSTRMACTMPGCGNPHHARRLCRNHYALLLKYGDPSVNNRPDLGRTTIQRLVDLTDQTGDCWLWVGSLNRAGYGQFGIDRTSRLAHRVSYELFVGPLIDDMQIDHLCHTPRCVNPSHLEQVTPAVNNERSMSGSAVNARKVECQNGHSFDEVNTYINPSSGVRQCRACRAEYMTTYSRPSRARRLLATGRVSVTK